jgi:predicted kinase
MVVLSGPPASGTSTWEAGHFDAEQVARTDTLRGVVATHEAAASGSNGSAPRTSTPTGTRRG